MVLYLLKNSSTAVKKMKPSQDPCTSLIRFSDTRGKIQCRIAWENLLTSDHKKATLNYCIFERHTFILATKQWPKDIQTQTGRKSSSPRVEFFAMWLSKSASIFNLCGATQLVCVFLFSFTLFLWSLYILHYLKKSRVHLLYAANFV